VNPTNDPYQDLDLGAEPFKPEKPGETITIVVDEVKSITTKTGKEGVLIAGEDDGDYPLRREWVAWNMNSKAELRREWPMCGDTLKITYDGRDQFAANPELAARLYTLKVLKRVKAAS
jgi:hypothetical protein